MGTGTTSLCPVDARWHRLGKTAMASVLAIVSMMGAVSGAGATPRAEGVRFEREFTCQRQYTGYNDEILPWLSTAADLSVLRHTLQVLGDAASHGLDPATYHAQELHQSAKVLMSTLNEPDQTLHAERVRNFNRQMTRAVSCYLQQVRSGQLEPEMVHAGTMLNPKFWQAVPALANAWRIGQVPALLADAPPSSRAYQSLRLALAQYRELANRPEPRLDLRIGSKRLNPAKLRPTQRRGLHARLRYLGDLAASAQADRSDAVTSNALRRFQRRHGLHTHGLLDRQTVRALRLPVHHRIAQIELSMERIRWLPRDDGQRRVLVNIPQYQLAVTRAGKTVMQSRTVVGLPGRSSTPFYAGNVDRIEFNPVWYVPHSVAKYKIVPELRRDPSSWAGQHMVIVDRNKRRHEQPTDELLEQVVLGSARLEQRPGKHNALGQVKFVLPNRRAIFLHDTDERHLYGKTNRALSFGCVRVEDASKLAANMLTGSGHWSAANVDRVLARGKTVAAQPDKPVLVVITYQTAVVAANGTVQFLPDIYGRDKQALRMVTRWQTDSARRLDQLAALNSGRR